MKKEEIRIEQAVHQFIGFKLAEQGFPLLELVSSMGLELEEWDIIKKKYCHDLNENDIKEIDEYFGD